MRHRGFPLGLTAAFPLQVPKLPQVRHQVLLAERSEELNLGGGIQPADLIDEFSFGHLLRTRSQGALTVRVGSKLMDTAASAVDSGGFYRRIGGTSLTS